MTRTIIAALLLATVAHAGPTLREVAAQKLATAHLAKWERTRWEQIAAGNVAAKPVTVFATSYGLWDNHPFKGDDYHIACNKLRQGTVVYVELTGRLMVVTNCGAGSNDAWARREGGQYWIDAWTRYAGMYGLGCKTTRLWVIGDAPEWRRK